MNFKSYNCHGKAIVLLNYWECKKILEGLMNNIQRREFQIFFPISKKVTSWIINTSEVGVWGRVHIGAVVHNQLQKEKKIVILTSEDHKQLVLEVIDILNVVNTLPTKLLKRLEEMSKQQNWRAFGENQSVLFAMTYLTYAHQKTIFGNHLEELRWRE